jgi:hypothetical protein
MSEFDDGSVKKRRSSEEIKKSLQKDRDKLYYERRKINKIIDSGNLSEKQLEKNANRLSKVEVKIGSLNNKLFKYSKTWEKLKSKKRELQKDINELGKKVKNFNLSDKDRKKAVKEMLSKVSKLNDLKILMDMKLGKGLDGGVQIEPEKIKENIETTTIGIWDFESSVKDTNDSSFFNTIFIDDKAFNLETEFFVVQQTVRKIVEEIVELRKKDTKKEVGYHIEVISNLTLKTVTYLTNI